MTLPVTVLVVEDEPIIRMDAVCMLEDAGFTVIEAEDAATALQLVDTRLDVRVVFSDINMPGAMNGLELAQEVYRRRGDVHFILTSGKVALRDSDIPDAGVYIPKPYSHDQVVRLVRCMATLP